MFRIVFLLAAVAATVLFLSNAGHAQSFRDTPLNPREDAPTKLSTGLKLGEQFKGELTAKEKRTVWATFGLSGIGKDKSTLGAGPDPNMYAAALPIQLKAGQPVTITATVIGQDRPVGVFILDPEGKRIQASEKEKSAFGFGTQVVLLSRKTAEIPIEEVSATGKHTIIVVSNRVGAFTVQATSGSGDDRESLERELKELRRRVAEIAVKLKALDEKGKK